MPAQYLNSQSKLAAHLHGFGKPQPAYRFEPSAFRLVLDFRARARSHRTPPNCAPLSLGRHKRSDYQDRQQPSGRGYFATFDRGPQSANFYNLILSLLGLLQLVSYLGGGSDVCEVAESNHLEWVLLKPRYAATFLTHCLYIISISSIDRLKQNGRNFFLSTCGIRQAVDHKRRLTFLCI